MLERQRELNEALARITRLRKMQRQLKTKGVEMIRRDVADMEELEDLEAKEAEGKARQIELETAQRQEAEAFAQMQQSCSSEVIDWSAFPVDPSFEGLLGEVAQGDFGGTPSADVARSSGA